MTTINKNTGHIKKTSKTNHHKIFNKLTLLGLLTATTMLTPAYADITLTEAASLTNPALDLASNIMGEGITINSAIYAGGTRQTGIFTNGAGLSFGDDVISFTGGVIFSTGRANTVAGPNSVNAGINASDGVVNDPEFNNISGTNTLNATWLDVDFTPELLPNTTIGDIGRITMNIVFGSEEYNADVYGNVNDTMAVIVNGENKAVVPNGLDYGIDTINDAATFPPFNGDVANDPNPDHTSVNFESANPSLYRNNTDNSFNTQMNGFTITIPVTFDIVMGQSNNIKIGIADASDFRNDSWLFVRENSGQTVIVAENDVLTTPANAPYNVDVLANDYDKQNDPLTIIRINDQLINSDDTITLNSGITVKLEADGTLTVNGDGVNPAHEIFTYEITDGKGGFSIAFVDATITAPDLTPPIPTIVVDNITADNILNLAESNASVDVTGTVGGEFNVGDTVTLSVNNVDYTDTIDAAGKYSITVSGAELKVDTTIDARVDTSDAAGNAGSANTSHDHTVDTVLPVSTISVNNITADNVINIAESNATVDVTGTVAGEFSAGDTVTLSINGNTYTGPVDAAGIYSITVSGADLVIDTLIDASVTTTDISGNTGSVATTHSHTIDITLPATPTINPLTTEDSTPTLTGTATLEVGDILIVTVGGAAYTVVPDGSGDWSLNTETATPDSGTFSPNIDAEANDVTAIVTDTTGNPGLAATNDELIIDSLTATNDSGSVLGTTGGQAIANVLTNDRLEGSSATISEVTLIQNSSTHINVTLNTTTGSIDVAAGTPKTTYTFVYEVCEKAKPTNCETATATVTALGDKDGDGIADNLDLDTDNDGISDTIEQLTAQNGGDTDSDGMPDEEDLDADGDGVSDLVESGLSPAQIATLDNNNDGVIDADAGANGLANALETDDTNTAQLITAPVNSDADSQPDYQDLDTDNDSIHDLVESDGLDPLMVDTNNDGVLDNNTTDADNDGIPDTVDTDNNALGGLSSSPIDTDSDGIPNIQDIESDGDGISDLIEASLVDPAVADTNNDGLLDNPTLDSDFDGIPDSGDTDNTGYGDPQTSLPVDSDLDTHPDYTDLDSDNDSLPDTQEAGNQDDNSDGILDAGGSINPTPTDTDNDGAEDFRDIDSDGDGDNDIDATAYASFDTDGDGRADDITDNENDGIPNVIDAEPGIYGTGIDLDKDGIPNNIDKDDDNDGLPDLAELDGNGNDVDTDGDGNVDRLDRDSDNDGIPDSIEAVTGTSPVDENGDGIIDSYVDTNNDGLHDPVSPNLTAVDNDNDSIPDFRDLNTDNDNFYDLFEASLGTTVDANVDGRLDIATDVDRDGLYDVVDTLIDTQIDALDKNNTVGVALQNPDTDADGIYDFRDTDSDNDGLSDNDESGSAFNTPLDNNNNGIADHLEALAANPGGGGTLETAVSGSGGNFGIFSLVFMLLLFGLRQFRRLNNSYKNKIFFSMTLLFITGLSNNSSANVCSGTTLESAFQPCLYAGGGIISSHVDPEGEGNGWSTSDDSDSGYTLFAGYHFKPNWFAEFAYTDMGEATLSNSFNAAGKESISYKVPSLHVGYLKETPIQQLNLYGKAGISAIQNKASSSSVPFEKQTNIQLSYGLGAQWHAINSPLFVRLGTDFHDRDARATNLSLGYTFGALKKAIPKATAIPAALPMHKPRQASPRRVDTDRDGLADNVDHCPLSKRGAPVDYRGCEINLPKPTFSGVLDGVNFQTGSAVLTPRANNILRQVAKQFKRWPDLKAIIVGHTDNKGSDRSNMILSFQRANKVTHFLLQNGVKRSSILSSLGRGEREPRASNASEAGRAMNRRVELLPQ